MKKALLALFITGRVLAGQYPQPTGYVNDFASILSPATQQTLETKLTEYEKTSSNQIAVVTLPNIGKETIESAAVALFEEWQIGQKGKDNGILLLIAVEERQVRIEVGYGLEPQLTDSQAGRIIRDQITPAFKAGDYDQGVKEGVSAIIQALTGGETMPSSPSLTSKDRFDLLGLAAVMITIYGLSYFWRSRRFWPGGLVGLLLGFLFASVVGAILIGLYGLFLDYFLSKNYQRRKAKGLPTSWGSSWGGFRSHSSGSGFSGFSGGRSGGGGASGGW